MLYILYCKGEKKYHIEANDIYEAQTKLRIINPDAKVLAYKKEMSVYEYCIKNGEHAETSTNQVPRA